MFSSSSRDDDDGGPMRGREAARLRGCLLLLPLAGLRQITLLFSLALLAPEQGARSENMLGFTRYSTVHKNAFLPFYAIYLRFAKECANL